MDIENINHGMRFDLGEEITHARIEERMTQKELAAKAEIPQSSLSLIERGLGNPSIKTLARIGNALGRKWIFQTVYADDEEDDAYDR